MNKSFSLKICEGNPNLIFVVFIGGAKFATFVQPKDAKLSAYELAKIDSCIKSSPLNNTLTINNLYVLKKQ